MKAITLEDLAFVDKFIHKPAKLFLVVLRHSLHIFPEFSLRSVVELTMDVVNDQLPSDFALLLSELRHLREIGRIGTIKSQFAQILVHDQRLRQLPLENSASEPLQDLKGILVPDEGLFQILLGRRLAKNARGDYRLGCSDQKLGEQCPVVRPFQVQFRPVLDLAIGVHVIDLVIQSGGSKLNLLETNDIHRHKRAIKLVESEIQISCDDELIPSS